MRGREIRDREEGGYERGWGNVRERAGGERGRIHEGRL